MRIRTIKPEFWTSETISPLSPEAKLLAIGLLNYSDDEGYFWSNCLLIRAALFPFLDESKTILGWLQDLSRAGYIRLGKRSDDCREVGQVINFKLHQRIDKPKPSIIKQNVKFLDESKTHPLAILDESQLEGKGREGNREGSGAGSPANFPESETPSWEEFWGYCQTQACLLPAEWYARDKFEAANADHWDKKSDWRAYARRVKGWWESDGRPMKAARKIIKPGQEAGPVHLISTPPPKLNGQQQDETTLKRMAAQLEQHRKSL